MDSMRLDGTAGYPAGIPGTARCVQNPCTWRQSKAKKSGSSVRGGRLAGESFLTYTILIFQKRKDTSPLIMLNHFSIIIC